MNNNEPIPIFILDDDAKKFLLFQQFYDQFTIMLDNDVFKVRNGSVVLHFDKYGVIQTINRSDILYSSRHTIN